MEWVPSTLHTTSQHGVPALLPLIRTPRLPVVDWTDAPRWFKWICSFRRKKKSGFCVCAITFQLASTYLPTYLPTCQSACLTSFFPSFPPLALLTTQKGQRWPHNAKCTPCTITLSVPPTTSLFFDFPFGIYETFFCFMLVQASKIVQAPGVTLRKTQFVMI